MKNLILTLANLLMIIGAVNAQYTLTDDDVAVSNGIITDCSYDFDETDIIIPEILDGQTVVGINANFNSKGITSVIFPETLELIEGREFTDNKIQEITFPKSIIYVGTNSFNNNILTSVIFNETSSLFEIGAGAFSGNDNLISVTLPSSTIYLSNYKDDFGNYHSKGSKITDFSTSYYLNNASYGLQDDDVVVENGIIIQVSYNFAIKRIDIPNTLDGQTVVGIKNFGASPGPFFSKGITYITLPSTLEVIPMFAFARNKIKKLTIPNSIITIGNNAFIDNLIEDLTLPNTDPEINVGAFSGNQLVSIVIPNTFTKIGESIFSDNKLTEVVIPNSVEEIKSGAFKNNKLKSFIIPNTVKKIGENAFYQNELIEVTISTSMTEISGGVFGNNNLVEILIPNNITSIGNSAFYGNKLESINIPDGVTSIGSYAFYNNMINSLILPNSLTSIESKAFCINKLTTIDIPNSINKISNGVFSFNKLTHVTFPNSVLEIDDEAFSNNELTNISIPNSVMNIGEYAFSDNSISSATFDEESSIVKIDKNCFNNNPTLTSVILPTHNNSTFSGYEDGLGNTYDEGDDISNFTTFYKAIVGYTLTDDDVVVEDGIIKSCSYDFAIKNIIIPETLDNQTIVSIGYNVFYYKGIENISLPESIESIGNKAFYYNELNEVIIPSGVTTIGKNSFENNNLKNLDLPNSITDIGEYAFSSNELESVILPSNISSIGQSAFSNNKLVSVKIPNTLEVIEEYVFYANELTSVIIPNSIKKIGKSAFRNNKLISVEIPNTLEVIEEYVFYSNQLTSVIIPNSIKKIGKSAFHRNKLENIIIPNSVKIIDQNAFYSNSLISLSIPTSVLSIGNGVFYSNKLSSVSFESDSNIQNIGNNAFGNNPSLTSVILPTQSSTSFVEYTDQNDVAYQPGNAITDFAIWYYSGMPYTLEDYDVVVEDNVLKSCSYDFTNKKIIIPNELDNQIVKSISHKNKYGYYSGNGVFYSKQISRVVLPETLEIIDKETFHSNNIVNLTLPNSIKTIGEQAFTSNKITSLFIPKSITTIGENSFQGNRLTSVTFENNSNIMIIGGGAFSTYPNISITLPTHSHTSFDVYKDENGKSFNEGGEIKNLNILYYSRIPYTLTDDDVEVVDGVIKSCSYDFELKCIIIPNKLDNQTILDIKSDNWSQGVFADNGIVEVELPNTIEKLGNNTFKKNNLISIAIPNTVTDLGYGTFAYNKLKSVVIPNSVTSINWDVFKENKLSSVDIPNSVYYIGGSAFSNNELNYITIPNSVTQIESSAFSYNQLYELTLPSSIVQIGNGAFSNNQLNSVTFDNSSHLEEIAEYAFSSNYNLSSIELPTNYNSYNFKGYVDSEDSRYSEGDTFWNFDLSYSTIKSHYVYFSDYDWSTISQQLIEYGGDAIAPSDPIRGGYTFTGWSEEFVNVTQDIWPLAQYDINTYRVVFYDYDNSVLKTEYVEYESSANSPTPPARENYNFIGWDKTFDNVVSELDINALYEYDPSLGNVEENSTQFEIYPNPTTDKAFISNDSGEELEIILLNNNGIVLSKFESNTSNIEIDISKYSSGIYFIRIENGNSTNVSKIIKN